MNIMQFLPSKPAPKYISPSHVCRPLPAIRHFPFTLVILTSLHGFTAAQQITATLNTWLTLVFKLTATSSVSPAFLKIKLSVTRRLSAWESSPAASKDMWKLITRPHRFSAVLLQTCVLFFS